MKKGQTTKGTGNKELLLRSIFIIFALVALPAIGEPGFINLEADKGIITAPFVATNGYIYQASRTSVTNGGRATFDFTITTGAPYFIGVLVNAPKDGSNSIYINIDDDPEDPTMISDIDVTTGFEQRFLKWQSFSHNFSQQNQAFILTKGTHRLIIVGRDPGVELKNISIFEQLQPPTNLHMIPSQDEFNLLQDQDQDTRHGAILYLQQFKLTEFASQLTIAVTNKDVDVRRFATVKYPTLTTGFSASPLIGRTIV
jgi:hypothetical protein